MQIKRGKIFNYPRPRGIAKRDLALVAIYIFKEYYIKYSEKISTEEELDTALEHYFLIKSWGL